ncbi:hypothetical protein EJ06DRAFT_324927 [Trichodelitschia bisporula]|uniref:Uncharacterized protein n=1 Tax=Trichodelitschia bisporula TaxID=703511 RepID=A0A6G1I4P8_9PEZI|nr:hypothetical protein EJ06DRAFT_324927 [Trichodelitschia bisporula]
MENRPCEAALASRSIRILGFSLVARGVAGAQGTLASCIFILALSPRNIGCAGLSASRRLKVIEIVCQHPKYNI